MSCLTSFFSCFCCCNTTTTVVVVSDNFANVALPPENMPPIPAQPTVFQFMQQMNGTLSPPLHNRVVAASLPPPPPPARTRRLNPIPQTAPLPNVVPPSALKDVKEPALVQDNDNDVD